MFSSFFDVEGHPEHSLSSTELRPSLKHLYHSGVWILLIVSSPNACLNVSEVPENVFPNLKQYFTQTRCS
jgi:hypothetical protein